MSEQDTTDAATVDDETQVEESAETQTESTTESESTDLGDAGKRAIDAMKAREKKARADTRAAITRAEAAETALANKDKPADEIALDAARAEARTEANTKANERILRADLRAAATGKLADPTDAALYLNLSEFTVSDDGDTDSDALTEAINELLTRKPHLAAGKPARFDGAADQGAKGKTAQASQLNDADLENMTQADVEKARREGRLNKLLGIN
jgi:hypothetical protein